jgi:hypothetical protein
VRMAICGRPRIAVWIAVWLHMDCNTRITFHHRGCGVVHGIVSIIFYGSFAGQGVLLYVRFAVKHGQ